MPGGAKDSAAPKADLLTPGIQVEIYSQQYGRLGPHSPAGIDPTDSLIAVQVEKSLASNTSNCTITLTAGIFGKSANETWAGMIYPMDFVTVHVSRSNETPRCIFMGFVESVQVTYSAPGPQAQRAVTIQAVDLGSELASIGLFIPHTNVSSGESTTSTAATQWLSLWRRLAESTVGAATVSTNPGAWLGAFLGFLGYQNLAATSLSLADLIQLFFRKVLPLFFSPTINLSNDQSGGLYSYEDFFILVLGDSSEFSAAAMQVAPPDGTFWNTLRSFCNPPLFELFTDVRSADEQQELLNCVGPTPPAQIWLAGNNPSPTFGPDQASYYLVFRPTPFYAERWQILTQHTLQASDIIGYTLGRDRTQVADYFSAYAEGWVQSMKGAPVQKLWPALADINQVLQYGAAPLMIRLYGLANFDAIPVNFVSPYVWALYDWYINNPFYIRGTLNVVGDPKYRIGQRLYLPDLNTEGYIESVTHDFVVFDHYTTRLQISRGQEPNTQPSAVERAALSLTPDEVAAARSVFSGIIDSTSGGG